MVGARASRTERVSYVVSNAYKKEKWRFLKDALWTKGLGSREGVREGLAWWGKGSEKRSKASVPGVGGRGTGSRYGANFATSYNGVF